MKENHVCAEKVCCKVVNAGPQQHGAQPVIYARVFADVA